MSSFMSIRQGKPGGFAGLFIIKVRDDEVHEIRRNDKGTKGTIKRLLRALSTGSIEWLLV